LICSSSLVASTQAQKSTFTVTIPRVVIASSLSGRSWGHVAPSCPKAIRRPMSRNEASV
jgi:hypothetical protein